MTSLTDWRYVAKTKYFSKTAINILSTLLQKRTTQQHPSNRLHNTIKKPRMMILKAALHYKDN